MPEYLAPGVYVEERSFRSKSIEGVSTSTTGFVGATRYGPTQGEPELMTSFSQFERIYGSLDSLDYSGTEVPNYLAHAVRAFFDNGGARLYIARAYSPPTTGDGKARTPIPAPAPIVQQASDAAVEATSVAQTALSTAIQQANKAKAAAITVLRNAANWAFVEKNISPAPTLVFDYGTGSNIQTQLGVPLTFAELSIELRTLITNADAAYLAAYNTLEDAAEAQTDISEAYASGVAAGNAVLDSALPADPTALPASTLNPLQTALDSVETAINGLSAPFDALDTALTAMSDIATSEDVLTAANNLASATNDVITAANGVEPLIQEAASAATVGKRAAFKNAQAQFIARFPGVAGDMTIVVTGRLAANALYLNDTAPAVKQIRVGDLVVINRGGSALIYRVERSGGSWAFVDATASSLALSALNPAADAVYPLTLTFEVTQPGKFSQPKLWDGLTISGEAARLRDSATQVFGETITNHMQELETPFILDNTSSLEAARLAGDLIGVANWTSNLGNKKLTQSTTYELTGGSDGQRPDAAAYLGSGDDSTSLKSGLKSFEDLEDISIVAAPGYSSDYATRQTEIETINQHLITHCETMRYRVAILDSPDQQSLSGARNYRARLDSTRAALYYPWIRLLDPVTNREMAVPPSGFMAGIYARTDIETGVHKAPANAVLRGAIGLETLLNKAQQDVLNPLGINCIRYFEGRGIRIWGARTVSSDPEWKYLNVRRYFAYLEASIDRSTQWAVFEPNGEVLWANIRRTVDDFLYNEWKEDRLAGTKPEEAYFVRCDLSTMTQNDLDNGRLICLIGVAPLYPAEFVIFRIGQWTADRR